MKHKIDINKAKKCVNFLENNKDLVGLSDYMIKFSMDPLKEPKSLARAEPDMFEKVIKIQVSEEFLKMDLSRQANILLHELIHARVALFNMKIENTVALEEEFMVNDITRGFERIAELNLWNRKI